jgi:hypothetical protein
MWRAGAVMDCEPFHYGGLASLQDKTVTPACGGARRRSLLLSFMPERMRAAQESCRALRNVRMDTFEVFVP